jgi:hypothetical protein
MRMTFGMKLLFAAGIASMSLFWIAPVPTDPPSAASAVVLVIGQPAPAESLCPLV